MGASLNFAHKAPHLPHLSFSPILLGSHRSGQVVVAFQRKVLENHLRLAKEVSLSSGEPWRGLLPEEETQGRWTMVRGMGWGARRDSVPENLDFS